MKFRLYYRGPLRANGDSRHKHQIRLCFSRQLEELWRNLPLSDHAEDLLNPEYQFNAITIVSGRSFTAVVNQNMNLISELEITMLRPEPPGSIVTQGGDIDNRLKTLLDALSIPNEQQVVEDVTERTDVSQFIHCLLEDDHLVTGFSVKVDRLLDSTDSGEVVVIVHVNISNTKTTLENLGLAI